MLRYFYLLCLLVCIKWSFCYDYISEQDNVRPVRKLRKETRVRHQRFRNDDRVGARREFEAVERDRDRDAVGDIEKDPVAQIDLTSFIQKPDYDSIEEGPFDWRNANGRGVAKDYGDYGSMSQLNAEDNINSQSRPKEYPNLGIGNVHDISANLDTYGAAAKNGYQDKYPMDSSSAHKPQKKCSLKQMKFPFFSHKKSETPKPKKNKKRRLFSHSNNKKTGATSSTSKSTDSNTNINKSPYELYKMKKRSYEGHICPLCRRKFNTNQKRDFDSRMVSSKLIHNSRQFFQGLRDTSKDKSKSELSNVMDVTESSLAVDKTNSDEDSLDDDFPEVRKKRDFRDYERERQLKELEEVRKKVDSVEINSQNFQKGNLS